ncbi:MAG: hypothetical protein EOO06_00225 [Chitinophagaceae bacterium]|nr:MAG: hypothetical protein EOO06_00225 [Chitinophagaceae bacterium]
MSVTYSPYLKTTKGSTDAKVYIRITENRSHRYVSLDETIKVSQWNPKKKEVRSSLGDESTRINQKIGDTIENLKSVHKETKNTQKTTSNSKQSFTKYFEDELNHLGEMQKWGSKKKYGTSYYHLQKFQELKKVKGTLFTDITSIWVRDFQTYLFKVKTPKETYMKHNSVMNIMKSIRRCYRLAIKQRVFIPTIDPFITFENTTKPVEKKHLTSADVEKIFRLDTDDKYLLLTKKCFLCQLYGQGMRVSDLLTLKFRKVTDDGRIEYTQFKTKKHHQFLLSLPFLNTVKDFLDVDTSHLSLKDMVTEYHLDGKKEILNIEQLRQKVLQYLPAGGSTHRGGKYDMDKAKQIQDMISEMTDSYYYLLKTFFINYAKKNPDKFIFPLLPNQHYTGIDFNDEVRLTKPQYNRLSSTTALYNKRLKTIQELCNIETTLTTHLSRHTYTNLLLMTTEDVYTVSKSLGHQKLETTQHYIDNFIKEKIDEPNQNLMNTFSIV